MKLFIENNMIKINLLNNETITTYKKHFENIPFFCDKLEKDEIYLHMTKKTLNNFLDKIRYEIITNDDLKLFKKTYLINVQGTYFKLEQKHLEKFGYLKAQFSTFY